MTKVTRRYEPQVSISQFPSTPEGGSCSDTEDTSSDSDDSQTICNDRDSNTLRRLYRQLSENLDDLAGEGSSQSDNRQTVWDVHRWGKEGPPFSALSEILIPAKRTKIDLKSSLIDQLTPICEASASDIKSIVTNSWKYNTELREHDKIICAQTDSLSNLSASLKRKGCAEISFQEHHYRRPWSLHRQHQDYEPKCLHPDALFFSFR
mmetsp:Transcript_13677/g.23455  ORF Transcript_13677/g.23455 Transcript_13677/m.23455 type:complete len:207 (+) Transcript_13677:52-672(+)